ncbi:MAG: MFS transporter [Acidimicrobiia bacterium]|nr:MFS transporter [Acidimicrobiia bacterium]
MTSRPKSVLSRELLPASISVYTMVALAAFESLAVAAALPDIAAELGRVDLLPWVITGYLLLSGVGAVVAGPLVDSVGVKLMFRSAVVIFVAGSTAAAFATTMPQMIGARVVQGAGAGFLLAVGLSAVNLLYPPHLIGRAFAANSTVWGVMGVAGPGIAGLILSIASWPWIFLVNLPLGIIALAAGWKILPGPVDPEAESTIDGLGIAMVLTFNLALLLAVDGLGPWSLVWIAVATATGFLYLRRARRSQAPVLKIRHLVEAPFGILALSIAMLIGGGISVHSFFTLYIRGARGAGTSLTAWSVMFFVIGWTVGANLSSRMLDRQSDSSVIMRGFVVTIASMIGVAAVSAVGWPLPVLFAAMLATGAGVGLATNAGLTLLRSLAASEEIGRATAAHQFFRNLGFSLGAALGGAIILLVVARTVGDVEVVRDLLAGGDIAGDPEVAEAIGQGFTATAVAGTVLASLGLIPFAALRSHLAPARAAADQMRSSG